MKFFGFKLSLQLEKQKDIIFFDRNYSGIKIKDYSFHNFNYKNINIIILFRSILYYISSKKKISIKDIYLKKYLDMIKPKIAIGNNFNDVIFKISKVNLKIKTIVYLHNRLYIDQIKKFKKYYYNTKVNYFFVCDKLHKNIISKFISSKFIINGLTKNNEVSVNFKKKKYDLMIISEYRNLPKNHFYTKCIEFIAKIISKYAEINNLKVLVALNSSREEKNKLNRSSEIIFFKKISSKFHFNSENSYQNAEISKLNICLASNLGADLLARGHKVLFLPFLANYSDKYKSMYLIKNSEFIHKEENPKEIYKKIDKLLNIKEKDWKNILIKSKIKFIFDKGNKLMKKIIRNIIEDDRKYS